MHSNSKSTEDQGELYESLQSILENVINDDYCFIYTFELLDEVEKTGFFEVNEWDLMEAWPEKRAEKLETLNADLEALQDDLDWYVQRAQDQKRILDLWCETGNSKSSKKARRTLLRIEKNVKRLVRERKGILREIAHVMNLDYPDEIEDDDQSIKSIDPISSPGSSFSSKSSR